MTAASVDRQRPRTAAARVAWPAWLAVTALGSSLACGPTVNEVHVELATAPSVPAFVLTDTTGHGPSGFIYGLSVVRCGSDSSSWTITALGSRSAPERIVYGQTPEGYSTTAGPQPLRSGCYDVYVTDGRRARFDIDGAGRLVIARSRSDTAHSPPDSARH